MSTQNEVTVNGGGRQYGTKLTAKGAAALAACILEGTKLEITEIAVGDGGGAYYEPMSSQTALVHEVWRDEVLSCEKSVLTLRFFAHKSADIPERNPRKTPNGGA